MPLHLSFLTSFLRPEIRLNDVEKILKSKVILVERMEKTKLGVPVEVTLHKIYKCDKEDLDKKNKKESIIYI